MITIIAFTRLFRFVISHFPSQQWLALDTVNTVIMMITFVVSQNSYARRLSGRPLTLSLEAATYVVSRGDHIRGCLESVLECESVL